MECVSGLFVSVLPDDWRLPVGSYVAPLAKAAKDATKKMGDVSAKSKNTKSQHERLRGEAIGDDTYRRWLLAMAALASLSASRLRSVSRLSQSCLPLAKASSHFTRPLRK